MQCLQYPFLGNTVRFKQVLYTALCRFDQGQQQMLHGDKVILHALCLLFGGAEGRIYSGTDIEPVCFPASGDSGQISHLCLGGSFQTFCVHAHFPQ